jgi:histidinol-phosphate/aromatic aminotransferase/cobyric acid decarboxylase-like protein
MTALLALPDRLTTTLRQDVQGMHAYAVQPSAGFIKLDAMENPFLLPPALQAELGQRLGAVAINRYPGGRIDELKTAVNGTPTKFSPCNCADIAYITKPGTGARTVAPGTSKAAR